MTRTPHAHRHFVAAPLFAVLMLFLVVEGGQMADSQEMILVQEEQADWSVFALRSGMQGIVYDDSSLDTSTETIRLEHGSVLVNMEGVAELIAGNYALYGLSGGFHVSFHGDDLNVAAVSSPVLVVEESRRLLVPVGYQWRTRTETLPTLAGGYSLWAGSRSLTPLPKRFQRQQLQNIAQLPHPTNEALVQRYQGTVSAYTPSRLLLPQAVDRQRERWMLAVLGKVRDLIDSNLDEQAAELLNDPAYSAAFSSFEAGDQLSILLARTEEDSKLIVPMLTHLVQDEVLWLLASVHPRYRSLTWTLFPPEGANKEARLARLFAFPQSDILPQSASAFSVQRWQQEVQTMDEASALIEQLLSVLTPLVQQQLEQGYPERALRLSDALQNVAKPYYADLSASAMNLVSQLKQIDKVDYTSAITLPAVAEEEEEDAALPEKLNEEEVKASAYDILRNAGALFTLETVMTATSPSTVHIQNIVFATSKGDQTFSFDLGIHQSDVRNVVIEGKPSPYSMSLEAFLHWVRK